MLLLMLMALPSVGATGDAAGVAQGTMGDDALTGICNQLGSTAAALGYAVAMSIGKRLRPRRAKHKWYREQARKATVTVTYDGQTTASLPTAPMTDAHVGQTTESLPTEPMVVTHDGQTTESLPNSVAAAAATAALPIDDVCPNGRRSAGTLFFGNITEWGPQSRTFFDENSVKDDQTPSWEAAAVAEHHLSKKKLGGVRRFFNTLGYKVGATIARQSKRSETGTNGGVFIAVPKGRSSTVRDYSSKVVDKMPCMTGDDWSIVILHRRGVDFAWQFTLSAGDAQQPTKRRWLTWRQRSKH